MLGVVMEANRTSGDTPATLDVVALLTDRAGDKLARGQVGTVVESLDAGTVLVEFSDNDGRAYAFATLPVSELLVLHHVPRAA